MTRQADFLYQDVLGALDLFQHLENAFGRLGEQALESLTKSTTF